MEGKKLVKSTLIYTIGNLGSKLLSFLLLPLFSIYLTPSQFGIYDLILGMINLLVPVVTIQISDATYRWLLEETSPEEKKKNISNGFLLLTSSIIVFLILFLVISLFIHFEYKSYFFILLIVSCYLPFLQQVARGLNKSKLYAIVGLINAALFLILTILLLVVGKYGLNGILIASIVSGSLSIIFLLIKSRFASYISLGNVSIERIKAMIKYSAPLIPNTISWWFINTADKYIILYFMGNEANGIYGLSTRFPGLITILNSIFMLSWQDYALSANEDKKNEEFSSRIFDHFVRFELSFVIFLISITRILLDLFISTQFSEAGKYIPLLFIGSVFSAFSGYLGTSYLKVKRTRGVLITSLIGAITNVLISFSLISHIGLYAPALGTLISFLVIFIVRVRQTKSFLNLKINYLQLVILSAIAILYSFFAEINTHWMSRLLMIVLSIIIIIILNKNLIIKISNYMQSTINLKTKN